MRKTVGEEKLALRCSAQELKAIDSLVLAGDFRNRSSLIRAALTHYLFEELRDMTPPQSESSSTPVELTPEELDLVQRFALLVHGGRMPDVLALLVRYGISKLEVDLRVKEAEERRKNAPVVARVERIEQSRPDLLDGESQKEAERHLARKGW